MNRVLVAVAKQQELIAERLAKGLVTPEKVEATGKSLDMELGEYVKFQELKTLAVAEGTLTAEEGQTVYRYLGNVPTTFNNQSVAVKAVLTQLFQQLLSKRLVANRTEKH